MKFFNINIFTIINHTGLENILYISIKFIFFNVKVKFMRKCYKTFLYISKTWKIYKDSKHGIKLSNLKFKFWSKIVIYIYTKIENNFIEI